MKMKRMRVENFPRKGPKGIKHREACPEACVGSSTQQVRFSVDSRK